MSLAIDDNRDDGDVASRPVVTGDLGRTFRESRERRVHRWYAYVEGYSADYLLDTFDELGEPENCFDPFGGSGTAMVEASRRGITSYFAEANPFMAFVIDTKVNATAAARADLERSIGLLEGYADRLGTASFNARVEAVDLSAYDRAFPGRNFFERSHLAELVAAIEMADELGEEDRAVRQLALLACASNVVGSSNMTRRADLRRRRDDEYKNRIVNVVAGLERSVEQIIKDIGGLPDELARARQVAGDCRKLDAAWDNTFAAAITSPPYLNGTNYVRNTKLELFLLGFITSELDLGPLRLAGVTAGITQAATSRPILTRFDCVEEIAVRLDACARDRRIPHLVRGYFEDMFRVLGSVFRALQPGAPFILDIGDSRFYGVHVPTHDLLASLAEAAGFVVDGMDLLARRHSRDKTPLVQIDLRLRKPAS